MAGVRVERIDALLGETVIRQQPLQPAGVDFGLRQPRRQQRHPAPCRANASNAAALSPVSVAASATLNSTASRCGVTTCQLSGELSRLWAIHCACASSVSE